jgi:hypothetical protein
LKINSFETSHKKPAPQGGCCWIGPSFYHSSNDFSNSNLISMTLRNIQQPESVLEMATYKIPDKEKREIEIIK